MKRLIQFSLTALLAVCCTSGVLEPVVETPTPSPAVDDSDMIILGEREAAQKTLAIRDRAAGNLGNYTLDESVKMFLKEIREKKLKYEPGTV